MSVTLAPLTSRVAVRPSDDPYKKYWWVILAGFGVTGAWLSLPMMETSVGSTRVDTTAPATGLTTGESSLDGSDNPNGAPGSTLDLAMDIAARPRKGDGSVMSSLYQAPDDPALPAEAAPAGAAAPGGTLADALKKAASSDPSGWGGQKAQKGFTQPKLGGVSAPGLGGGSGSGTSASASATGGVGAFGSQSSQVGFAGTSGLKGSVSDMPEAKNAKGALANAASAATKAANSRSGDAAVSGLSKVFDGRSERGGSAIGGDGGEAIGAGGIYGSLDAAPENLKINDPNLDKREFKEPPAKVANKKDNRSEELKQQMAMMLVTMVVGGMVGGTVGQAMTGMIPMMMQMNQVNQRSESQLKDK